MKNKYLTKQQKNDIAISILYDWALCGRREYPSMITVGSRLSVGFTSQFDTFSMYAILLQLRTMMSEIEYIYALSTYTHIYPVAVKSYATKHGFHISPMKVITP